MNETLKAHLRSITNDASVRAMAMQAGLEPSTVLRQLDGDPKVQTVVAICRAYKRPILPALVAAGFITNDEAHEMSVTSALREATDRQLVEETLRRVSDERPHPALTEPLTAEVVDAARAGGVGGDIDTESLEDVDLSEDYDLAATHDDSAIDPSRGEA